MSFGNFNIPTPVIVVVAVIAIIYFMFFRKK
jgi:hypothetical protein